MRPEGNEGHIDEVLYDLTLARRVVPVAESIVCLVRLRKLDYRDDRQMIDYHSAEFFWHGAKVVLGLLNGRHSHDQCSIAVHHRYRAHMYSRDVLRGCRVSESMIMSWFSCTHAEENPLSPLSHWIQATSDTHHCTASDHL